MPFRAVRQAWAQKAGLPLTGCCGKELQIVALRMKYKGDFYHTFTFEKQNAAEQVLALLADGCPDVVLEPERPARKVCEATDG